MMRMVIQIDDNKSEGVMEGMCNNKKDIYAMIGVMEDMKFKLLSAIQGEDDKSFFSMEKRSK